MKKTISILSALALGLGITLVSGAASADEAGAAIWKAQKCGTCHGETGKAEWQKKLTDDAIKAAITKGVDRTDDGVAKKMKAYDKLKPEEVDSLLKLIRSWAPKA